MMSHQCGLAAFSRTASVFDHEDGVRALEETVPAWQPRSTATIRIPTA